MNSRALLLSLLSLTASARAGVQPASGDTGDGALTLAKREELSIGGVLFPHFHFQAVYGETSFDEGEEFAAGHHDPVSDGWTVQGFELGLSGRFNEYVEAFTTWHGYWSSESPHTFDSGFEEYFLKLKNLPGGLELRGGQYLNRFGLHNATHLHGWDWVDNYLAPGRFLGDDGLTSRGAELTWRLPVNWTSNLSVSYGDVRVEEHEHHHEEGHDEGAALFEAEGAAWSDRLTTVLWTNQWNLNDFHQFRGGLSAAWGDNVWGRTTALYGAHFQYEWRKNGLEAGGDYVRWRTEVLWRDASVMSGHLPGEEEEAEEDGDHDMESLPGDIRDWGLYSSLVWGKTLKHGVLESGLRFDYVSGEGSAGLASRHRISPGVTWYFDNRRTAYARLQGNFDDISGHGSEQSVWFGFGINYGGAEVR